MSIQRGRRNFLFALLGSVMLGSRGQAAASAQESQRWTCTNQDCDPFIYDPRLGAENVNNPDQPIPPGVSFADLPEDWICPVCGDPKGHFLPLSR
ncbi:MAG: rubredoxin [Magnetospiraceae bacterium]